MATHTPARALSIRMKALLASSAVLGTMLTAASPASSISPDCGYVPVAVPVTGPVATASNLVGNPNFEAGNTAFTSDYTYQVGRDPYNLGEGRYAVDTSGFNVHSDFSTDGDRTTGSGKFLVANGAADTTQTIWRSNGAAGAGMTVKKGKNYRFEAWISSMVCNSTGYFPPLLNFQVGVQGASGITWTNLTATGDYGAPQWLLATADWKATTNGRVVIRLVNAQPEASGNDFGLDDIYFGLRSKSPSFCATINTSATTKNRDDDERDEAKKCAPPKMEKPVEKDDDEDEDGDDDRRWPSPSPSPSASYSKRS